MNDLILVAKEVFEFCEERGLRCCLVGGVALQFRGEVRATVDVDFSVLTGFVDDEATAHAFLQRFASRIPNPIERALGDRILLLEHRGLGLDILFAGFPFEERVFDRIVWEDVAPGVRLPIIAAEDLIVMKGFAARPQDLLDIRGIIIRNGSRLDWDLVETNLRFFSEEGDDSRLVEKVLAIRAEVESSE